MAGILRVNKKNRSDAYVTTSDLDADIFICGSKDRNRALEGDLVAIELLDVDEVGARSVKRKRRRSARTSPMLALLAIPEMARTIVLVHRKPINRTGWQHPSPWQSAPATNAKEER